MWWFRILLRCAAASAFVPSAPRSRRAVAAAANDGLVLANVPGVVGEDSLGGPVVHYYPRQGEWFMWYHGRGGGSPPAAALPPISSGRIGLARSSDGIIWERVLGPGPGGSVLSENDDQWWSFDTAHVGLGDVVPLEEDAGDRVYERRGPLAMFLFGGADTETEFRSLGIDRDGSMPAMDLRVGLAVSQGDPAAWGRVEGDFPTGEVVSTGDGWDSTYVGWPSVVDDESRLVYYQALDLKSQKHAIGLATQRSLISFVNDAQPVFAGSGNDFDAGGVSRRCVRKDSDGEGFTMWYEGLAADRTTHAIGLATSPDGRTWTAQPDPVFRPSEDDDAWDSAVVSAPYVVRLDDHTLRLYYAGAPKEQADLASSGPSASRRRLAIGAADSADRGRSWTRVPSTLTY